VDVETIRMGNIIAFLSTGILSSPLFGWAWPYTSVIDIVAGAYIRIPIRLDQGQDELNSNSWHD
jgi:hypothetical protein